LKRTAREHFSKRLNGHKRDYNEEDFIQRAEKTVGKPDRFNARWIKSVELNRPSAMGIVSNCRSGVSLGLMRGASAPLGEWREEPAGPTHCC
jgi:hypothetical protein